MIRTRHTKDISLVTYIMFVTGVALWLAYGIILMKLPIILCNAITLIPTIVILVMKLRERKA